MKRKNYMKICLLSVLFVGLGGLTSCDDAKYNTLDTHAYINEALSGTSVKVNVDVNNESSTTLDIHVSDAAAMDSHYS
jgi:hypothetical protein